MQSLQLPQEEKLKLEKLTMPLRDKWVKDMEAKGLPGKAVLEAAIKYIQ
jgi:hypothetical protein